MYESKPSLLKKDSIFKIDGNGTFQVISDNYFYKSEAYYLLVEKENDSVETMPRSTSALEAYIVPICLERARLADIPVAEWEVSYSYTPFPCVIYGINYYASPSEFHLVRDRDAAIDIIKTITHNEKYPFIYQKLSEKASMRTVVSIFGRTCDDDKEISHIAKKVFDIFRVPVIAINLIQDEDGYRLSSLAPIKYSTLTLDEKKMIEEHVKTTEAYNNGKAGNIRK
jgi:hypothetical protein